MEKTENTGEEPLNKTQIDLLLKQEHDKARNQAIDDVLLKVMSFTRYSKATPITINELKEILESLKTKTMTPTEREQAIWMANKALDAPNADPDDDLRTISRQFLRSIEQHDKARNQAIQDCIDIVSVTPGDESVIPKLEQLKTKP